MSANDITKFDLRRLTLVGWLLFVGSAVFGLTCLAVTWMFYAEIFSPELLPDGSYKMYPMIPFFAFFFGALGSFFAAKTILGLLGVTAVRSKESEYTPNPSRARRLRKEPDESDDD